MFKDESEDTNISCKQESSDTVQLADGSRNTKFLGEGTLKIITISLPNCVNFSSINGTLISAGHIFDQKLIKIFTETELVILCLIRITVNSDNILAVRNRNRGTSMYEFKEPEMFI